MGSAPPPENELELSVVVPVYGCRDCLVALYERLTRALERLAVPYEVVLVDDRSPDGAWDALQELARRDARLRLVRLSRNFGQHAAITAGLAEATGRWTVVMDCDLEDRPEEIGRLWAKAQEGFDIVFAARRDRGHSRLRRSASSAYARVLNRALGTQLRHELGNFSVISAKVREAFLRLRDRDRQYLMILFWLGFRSTSIDVQQGNRHAGRSAYSLRRLVSFALDGLFFQTVLLLRWIVYAGFAVSLAGAAFAAFLVVNYFLRDPYPGWTTLGVLILLIGGFIITSTGVAGLYVGRIYNQVKDRPLYVVDERVTGDESTVPDARAEASEAVDR